MSYWCEAHQTHHEHDGDETWISVGDLKPPRMLIDQLWVEHPGFIIHHKYGYGFDGYPSGVCTGGKAVMTHWRHTTTPSSAELWEMSRGAEKNRGEAWVSDWDRVTGSNLAQRKPASLTERISKMFR